jgi:dTDP-4-dehydrorhamnose 3,5-epimerase-like enzyme
MQKPISLPGGCRLIELPNHEDARGALTIVEAEKDFPFPIRRIYWIHNVPGGQSRGGHAHEANTQFIIPVKGSFSIELDDGHNRTTVHMDRSNVGVLVPPMTWSFLKDFELDTVCLVVAALPYCPTGYINDYDDFLRRTAQNNP